MAFGNLEDKNRFKMTHENERTNELNTERTEYHRFSSNALARWNIGTQKKKDETCWTYRYQIIFDVGGE